MSPDIKWKKRASHHIMGFQMSLAGRTVAAALVLTHISMEVCESLQAQFLGTQGEEIAVMV